MYQSLVAINTAIGNQPDFITEKKKNLNLPQGYELDSVMPPKNNKDHSMKKYGRQLLDLCIEAKGA